MNVSKNPEVLKLQLTGIKSRNCSITHKAMDIAHGNEFVVVIPLPENHGQVAAEKNRDRVSSMNTLMRNPKMTVASCENRILDLAVIEYQTACFCPIRIGGLFDRTHCASRNVLSDNRRQRIVANPEVWV